MSVLSSLLLKLLATLGANAEAQVVESALVNLAESEGVAPVVRMLVLPQAVEAKIAAKTGGDIAAIEAAKTELEAALTTYIGAFEPK